MQSETQKMSNQQGTTDAAKDAAAKKTKMAGASPGISDEDTEPVLDEEDMKENHLKEEDLDKIEWDKPASPDEELSKDK